MYCTTKIYKKGYPVRLIVDYMGSIAYQTSKALAKILSSMVGKTKHHVSEDDVVSLFTNTHIKKSLEIVREYLEADSTFKERNRLNTVMELFEFCITNILLFRRVIYKQKFGVAMGTPCSAIIANNFMEWLEQKAIADAPSDCHPNLWKRYVDDILEIIPMGSSQKLTAHLNKADPTNSINITHEEEADG